MKEFFGYKDMSPEEFRELQLIELDMLVYFDEFCREHGLRYYLAGGTLIGAVRHKGFIPWDEDIDLHMPRPDYDRLPALWKEYADTETYTLCITDREHNFRHHVYTICNNNTTMIEERTVNDDIPQGIRIDILPWDGVPANRFKSGIQFLWAILYSIYNVQRLPENQGGKAMRYGVAAALNLVKDPDKRYKIWTHAQDEMRKYDFDGNCKYVRELASPLRAMQFKYPRKDFDKPVMLDFEGHKFPAQHYYLQYLNNFYPGFMTPPPVEKRVQKTRAIYINLERGYKEYKGIYYCKDQQDAQKDSVKSSTKGKKRKAGIKAKSGKRS